VSTIVTAALDGLALLLLIVGTRRARTIDLPFGLATLVALLISPHVLIHDLTLLLVPVAISLHHRQTGLRHLTALLVGSYLALTVGFALPLVVPIQLAVLAMVGLGLWLFFSSTPPAPSHLPPLPGQPRAPWAYSFSRAIVHVRTICSPGGRR
jgi:hypothetical protein